MSPPGVEFVCNNFFQTLAKHHYDAVHETPHLYDMHDFDPSEVRAYDTVFVKTDLLDSFLGRVRPLVRAPFRLVTGHSDLTPSDDATELIMRDPGIVSWKAQNVSFETFKLSSIPMGLSEPSRPFGNQDVVNRAVEKFSDPAFVKADKIVVPNSSPTHPIRAAVNDVVDRLKDRFSQEMKVLENVRLGYGDYLDSIGAYKYCLVVRGNAIDCHRVYECVLARTVPVLISDGAPAFYKNLPVIVLQPGPNDDLERVVEKFLLKIRLGELPPLPTEEEWKRYADILRTDNYA